jgi:hypothetical protein
MRILLLAFCFSATAWAQETQVSYSIEHARFQEVSERRIAVGSRQFIKFQNPQGSHVLIYDEETAQAALRNLANLKQVMGIPETECRIDLDCSIKAFCTSGCRSMYYELSNSLAAPPLGMNRCAIRSFQCGKIPAPVGVAH